MLSMTTLPAAQKRTDDEFLAYADQDPWYCGPFEHARAELIGEQDAKQGAQDQPHQGQFQKRYNGSGNGHGDDANCRDPRRLNQPVENNESNTESLNGSVLHALLGKVDDARLHTTALVSCAPHGHPASRGSINWRDL